MDIASVTCTSTRALPASSLLSSSCGAVLCLRRALGKRLPAARLTCRPFTSLPYSAGSPPGARVPQPAAGAAGYQVRSRDPGGAGRGGRGRLGRRWRGGGCYWLAAAGVHAQGLAGGVEELRGVWSGQAGVPQPCCRRDGRAWGQATSRPRACAPSRQGRGLPVAGPASQSKSYGTLPTLAMLWLMLLYPPVRCALQAQKPSHPLTASMDDALARVLPGGDLSHHRGLKRFPPCCLPPGPGHPPAAAAAPRGTAGGGGARGRRHAGRRRRGGAADVHPGGVAGPGGGWGGSGRWGAGGRRGRRWR